MFDRMEPKVSPDRAQYVYDLHSQQCADIADSMTRVCDNHVAFVGVSVANYGHNG